MTPTVLNAVENPPLSCTETITMGWMNSDSANQSYPDASNQSQVCDVYRQPACHYNCGNDNMAEIANVGDNFTPSSASGYATFNDFKGLYPSSSSRESPFSGYYPYASEYGSTPQAEDHTGFTALERFAMSSGQYPQPGVGCQKTRIRTNLRKRERNLNINKAFEDLRGKIPNLPADTKVSKIKVLRLAADYIRHLNQVLEEANEQDNIDSEADLGNMVTPQTSSPCGDAESRKRSRDEFKVDPDIVTIKRRKIDWGRIQEEIARHQNTNKSKRSTKQQSSSSNEVTFSNTFPYQCVSNDVTYPQPIECHQSQNDFGFHQAVAHNVDVYPLGGANYLNTDASSSPTSFSSWDTE